MPVFLYKPPAKGMEIPLFAEACTPKSPSTSISMYKRDMYIESETGDPSV